MKSGRGVRGDAYSRPSDVRPGQLNSLMSFSSRQPLTRERNGSNTRARESRKRRAWDAGAARGDAYVRSSDVRLGQLNSLMAFSSSQYLTREKWGRRARA